MTTGYFGNKQVAEEYYEQFDFGSDIGSATIATAVIVAVDENGADVTATLLDATKQNVDGSAVNFWVQAGTNDTEYTITCDVDTSSHEHYTKVGILYVINDPVAEAAVVISTDWSKKQDMAKRMIDKYGDAMSLILETHNTYNATADSYSSAETTYSTRGVLLNPTMINEAGQYSKSNKIRVLLSAKNLPVLDNVDFRIEYGSEVWHPEKTVPLKPGGTTIIYFVDVK
ncbi:MAG: hypothetical protein WC220_11320 [Pedobacter sp.]|jgi:hypothetical protein